MSFETVMKNYSQALYGTMVALDILEKSKFDLTDVSKLENSILALLKKKSCSQLGNVIEPQVFKEASIKLNGECTTEIIKLTSNQIINVFFIQLATILEATIDDKFNFEGKTLREKIDSLMVDNQYEWAKKAVQQLRCIRNSLVHNNGKWSQRSVNDIKNYVSADIKIIDGDEISLCFEDIFRFKRAVRTFVNNAAEK